MKTEQEQMLESLPDEIFDLPCICGQLVFKDMHQVATTGITVTWSNGRNRVLHTTPCGRHVRAVRPFLS